MTWDSDTLISPHKCSKNPSELSRREGLEGLTWGDGDHGSLAPVIKVVTLSQAPLVGVHKPLSLAFLPSHISYGCHCPTGCSLWLPPILAAKTPALQKDICSMLSLQTAQLGEICEYLSQIQNAGCRKKASLPEETVTRVPWPQTAKALHRDMVPTVAQTKTWPQSGLTQII